MQLEEKMARYGLSEADLIRENGHAFVEISRLGLRHEGHSCLFCGVMRRADAKNGVCKGHVALTLRENVGA